MNKFIKIILTIILFFIMYFLEFNLISEKELFGIKPNLILVTVIISVIFFNNIFALLYGLALGIVMDIIYIEGTIGKFTIIYLVISLILIAVKNYILKNNISSAIYIAAIGTLIFEISMYLIFSIGYKAEISFIKLIFGTIFAGVLNIGITLILYNIFSKIYLKNNKVGIYFK